MFGLILSLALTASPTPTTGAAFYGSSTTVGVGASRPERSWTAMCCKLLGWNERNFGLSGSAVVGGDVPSALDRLDEVTRGKHDRVFLMYGANDVMRQSPEADFRSGLRLVAEKLETRYPGHVVLIAPQPAPALRAHRAVYDRASEDVARDVKLPFIAGWQAFPAELVDAYSHDSLHLNDWGHAALASYVAGEVRKVGLAPDVPVVRAGAALPAKLQPLPGARLRVSDASLATGALDTLEVGFTGKGQAVLAVVRPVKGGFEGLYRTPAFAARAGKQRVRVPHWAVLAGDRLAAWSEPNVLGGFRQGSHLSSPLKSPSWLAAEPRTWQKEASSLALRAL